MNETLKKKQLTWVTAQVSWRVDLNECINSKKKIWIFMDLENMDQITIFEVYNTKITCA